MVNEVTFIGLKGVVAPPGSAPDTSSCIANDPEAERLVHFLVKVLVLWPYFLNHER